MFPAFLHTPVSGYHVMSTNIDFNFCFYTSFQICHLRYYFTRSPCGFTVTVGITRYSTMHVSVFLSAFKEYPLFFPVPMACIV
ncbi:unnamed protein product [Taenia asiatica]|uniref:Ovule protein n=1 Tax=Taenia asiatica TaxID=60517 RepID=A0A0R3WDM2_TAEAS|nr:unnamed protein product [Taenia asiatica]